MMQMRPLAWMLILLQWTAAYDYIDQLVDELLLTRPEVRELLQQVVQEQTSGKRSEQTQGRSARRGHAEGRLFGSLISGLFGEPQNPFAGPLDPFGRPVDQFGRPVDQFGRPVNQFGGQVDQFGRPVNQFGGQLDQFGRPVDQFGRPVDQFGQPQSQPGQSPGSLLLGPNPQDPVITQSAALLQDVNRRDPKQCIPRLICSAAASALTRPPTTAATTTPAPPVVRPPSPPPPVIRPPSPPPTVIRPPSPPPPVIRPPSPPPSVIRPPSPPPVVRPPSTPPPGIRPPSPPPVVRPPSTPPPEVRPPAPPEVAPPSIRPPEIRPPSIRPPEIRPPSIKPPEVRPPSIRPPEVRPPSIKPPEVRPPSIKPPSVTPSPPGIRPPSPPVRPTAPPPVRPPSPNRKPPSPPTGVRVPSPPVIRPPGPPVGVNVPAPPVTGVSPPGLPEGISAPGPPKGVSPPAPSKGVSPPGLPNGVSAPGTPVGATGFQKPSNPLVSSRSLGVLSGPALFDPGSRRVAGFSTGSEPIFAFDDAHFQIESRRRQSRGGGGRSQLEPQSRTTPVRAVSSRVFFFDNTTSEPALFDPGREARQLFLEPVGPDSSFHVGRSLPEALPTQYDSRRTSAIPAGSGRVRFVDDTRSGRSSRERSNIVRRSFAVAEARRQPRAGSAGRSSGGRIRFPARRRRKRFVGSFIGSFLRVLNAMAQPYSFYPYTTAALEGSVGTRDRCARLFPSCPASGQGDFVDIFNNLNQNVDGGVSALLPPVRVPALDAFYQG